MEPLQWRSKCHNPGPEIAQVCSIQQSTAPCSEGLVCFRRIVGVDEFPRAVDLLSVVPWGQIIVQHLVWCRLKWTRSQVRSQYFIESSGDGAFCQITLTVYMENHPTGSAGPREHSLQITAWLTWSRMFFCAIFFISPEYFKFRTRKHLGKEACNLEIGSFYSFVQKYCNSWPMHQTQGWIELN